jgi:hypothetical protein
MPHSLETIHYLYTIRDGAGGVRERDDYLDECIPDAANDELVLDASGTPLDVLANDQDPDSDSLSLVSVEGATLGIVEVAGNQVVYSPGVEFEGTDTFTYTVTDGRGGYGDGRGENQSKLSSRSGACNFGRKCR